MGILIFMVVVFVCAVLFLNDRIETIDDEPQNKQFHYYIEHYYKSLCYVKFMNPETGIYEYLREVGGGDFSNIIYRARFKKYERQIFRIEEDFDKRLSKFKSIEDVKKHNKRIYEEVDKHNKNLKQKEKDYENGIRDRVSSLNKHLE